MRFGLTAGAIIICLTVAGTARAATEQDVAWCKDASSTDEQALHGCSAMIKSGSYHGAELAMAYHNRAIIYGAKGRTKAAIRDFDLAIRTDPNDAKAYNGRCWTRAVAGRDLDRALADCDAALKLGSRDADTRDSRGLVHLKTKKWTEAVADYGAALEIESAKATSLYGRGVAKNRLAGRSGNEDIAAATKIDPAVAKQFKHWGVVVR